MMDCGAVCLQIISKYYGRYLSQQRLRDLCHITHNGVSLLGISDAAEAIGFRTVGVKITWEQLKSDATLPCIVHWNQSHFIVVYKIIKKREGWKVCVSDPGGGLLEYPIDSFLKSWLQIKNNRAEKHEERGVALLLGPRPVFYNEEGEEEKGISLWKLIGYLRPYKSYIIQVLFAMLTASIISMIFPFLTQAMVDTGIGSSNISFVLMILIAQMCLVVGQMANNVIRSWLMLHITTRISISLISDFLNKLMRLPIAFFDSKHTGDILQRIHDYNRIQSFLTGALISTAMAVVTFLIYAIIMSSYNSSILIVFVIGSIFYLGWIEVFMKRRKKLDYMQFQEASANQSNLIQLVNGMQEIKLNNCERQRRWEWEHIQAKLFRISTRSLTLGQTQDIGGSLIDQTKNIIISFIAAEAVITGNMTLGAMVALQYIIGQLNAPLNQFVTFMQSLQDARISMERMSEIHEKEDEENCSDDKIREIPKHADIELYNVSYQYDGPRSPKVIDNLTLKIPANRVTAIVGASGSGKTTLLKMLLGFYEPCEGEIRIDGRLLENYSISQWRKNCGVVMQDGFIFYNTIASNISLSDEKPDMKRVKEAARRGNISSFIDSLPMRYNTKIGTEGHGLSSGQKQRILIARAIYKDAKYLLFDEATNSLDANNEKFIIEQLDSFFQNKTVIIVAHRLSTVKNADNIVVLGHGHIVEQGTHEHLIAQRRAYYELVKNQLELGN
jgi:ATP-binding cassette subfamily B protein